MASAVEFASDLEPILKPNVNLGGCGGVRDATAAMAGASQTQPQPPDHLLQPARRLQPRDHKSRMLLFLSEPDSASPVGFARLNPEQPRFARWAHQPDRESAARNGSLRR